MQPSVSLTSFFWVFMLQAPLSLCSQQDPMWLCLPSKPTAMATQQRQATASRHSPTSVMACERPPTIIWPNPFPPSVLLSLCSSPASHGLLLTTGPQASNRPLSFWVLFFYYVVLSHSKTKHLPALKDFYLYCLKRNWTIFLCIPHSIFMTTYLDSFVFIFHVMSFFLLLWFVQKWTC